MRHRLRPPRVRARRYTRVRRNGVLSRSIPWEFLDSIGREGAAAHVPEGLARTALSDDPDISMQGDSERGAYPPRLNTNISAHGVCAAPHNEWFELQKTIGYEPMTRYSRVSGNRALVNLID